MSTDLLPACNGKGANHINLVAAASGLREFEEEAKNGGDVKFVNLYSRLLSALSALLLDFIMRGGLRQTTPRETPTFLPQPAAFPQRQLKRSCGSPLFEDSGDELQI